MSVGKEGHSLLHVGLTIACIAIVTVAAFFSRKTGACGTAHYLTVQLLGGMAVSLITSIWQTSYQRLLEQGAAIAVNIGFFSAMTAVWYYKAPRRWYVVGLLVWTAFYLGSYFFFFPTVDCP